VNTKPAKIASLKAATQDGTFTFAIIALALWMMSRPFKGIGGDGRIYMTRALADLHPETIGRDMMFAFDGQSQFSVFTKLSDWLVSTLNPANAALFLAVLNLVWLLAAYRFIARFAEGRTRLVLIAIMAVVPSAYGAFGLIHFGETIPVPRPLAETFVLVALTFLVDEKRLAAFACLVAAALFHPIMALPGFGIFALDLCWKDRRFIWLAIAGAVLALVAAFAGLPLFDRLSMTVDPEWLLILRQRNPYLFPSLWPFESFSLLALELATIWLALRHIELPCVRMMFVAAIAVGCAGLLAAYVFGDLYPLVLVVQTQLWRATWFIAAFGALSLGIVLVNLRGASVPDHLSAMALAIGWLFLDMPVLSLCCGLIALICARLPEAKFAIHPRLLGVLWATLLITGFLSKLGINLLFAAAFLQAPPDFASIVTLLWNIDIIAIPFALIACVWAWQSPLLTPMRVALLSLVAISGAIFLWSLRTPVHRYADSAPLPKDLAALLPDDKAEVLWLGDRDMDPWYLARNPNWVLFIQGAGIVFSRPLALLWHERIKVLVDLGLAEKFMLQPWLEPSTNRAIVVTRTAVDALCTRSDAPAAIMVPREADMTPPQDITYRLWVGIPSQYRLEMSEGKISWHKIDGYMVIACAGYK